MNATIVDLRYKTKKILEALDRRETVTLTYHGKVKDIEVILKNVTGLNFYNISPYTFARLLDDPKHIAKNFRKYVEGFSENIRDIIEKFDFEKQIFITSIRDCQNKSINSKKDSE